MVIGPTPPGTGVIAPATFAASAKATSPTMRDLPSSPGTRLMPTSITVAPGLIQSPRTISGRPDGGDQQVGAPAHTRQIARLGMGDRHRRILRQQQLRHRLADDVGAADHHRFQAGERRMHGLGQQHAAERRARHQRRQAAGEPPDIERMEAVDVLGRIDGGDDLLRVDLLRQRQLHQDAVHCASALSSRDQRRAVRLRWSSPAACDRTRCMPASATALDLLRT